jgi:hypothetical protein
MSEKELEQRIERLEKTIEAQEKKIAILTRGRIGGWFENARDYIIEKEIVTRMELLSEYPQMNNNFTNYKFLQAYPEIKRLKLPMRGEKSIYLSVGKDGNRHPAKLLLNSWHTLLERKGLPYAVIKEHERCPDEQMTLVKSWARKHLTKWLLVNNEGIYKK